MKHGKLVLLAVVLLCGTLAPANTPPTPSPKDIAAERIKAEKGEVQAQANLGYWYEFGIGTRKDDAESAKWYLRAARQGNRGVQYSLGFMYAEGRGVQKDVVEAYKWWLLAGDPTTITMDLETVKKEKDAKIIRSNLTPEQREEGERRAREFKPTTPK